MDNNLDSLIQLRPFIMLPPIQSIILCYSLLSYSVFALALAGIAGLPAVLAACAICACVCPLLLKTNLFSGPNAIAAQPKNNSGTRAATALLLLTAIPMLHVLIIPPYMRDDLIYHLLVPKNIAHSGGISFDPYNINSNFPMLFEMPLVLLEQAKRFISPFVVNLGMLFLLSSAFYAMARNRFGVKKKPAMLATTVLAYTPVLYDLAHSCYVEIFFSLLILLAFFSYLDFCDHRDQPHSWYLAMAFCALACATKYTGLFFLLFFAAAGFFQAQNRRHFYQGVGLAILILCPWYLKNWIVLGNPIYPLANAFFESPYVSQKRLLFFNHMLSDYTMGREFTDYLLVPFRLLAGINESSAQAGQLGFGGKLSLFFVLACIGLGWKEKGKRLASLLFALYFIFWAATSQQVRFLLPVLIISSLFGLQLLDRLWTKYRIASIALMVAALVQNLCNIGQAMKNERIVDLLCARISKDNFLEHHLPNSYGIAKKVNALIPSTGSRIFVIGNFGRNYYFDAAAITTTYYETELVDRAFKKDSVNLSVINAFLDKEKITHVLFNSKYFSDFHRDRVNADNNALQEYFESAFNRRLTDGNIILWERNTGFNRQQ